ncbi:dihydrofolate reductase family protein [Paenarthrobacter aurescens]|uniref:dihydrofolate reductase family protein n=1 Tax=Paenarthrobacter aurescens TaxID=43663 RepID=UPI0021C15F26|nr:dihydrofolate reductase family protein [Paenarthrobacter aurescens]MCT9869764.1 dihydrofolate reductase family protein [Paenarthrobacter aurescens]
MAKLIYSAIMSLDGFIADAEGNFDWGVPDQEVHRFINARERTVQHYLYGRRLYDVMSAWDSWDTSSEPAHIDAFAQLWRQAQKLVFSRTLKEPSTGNTRIVSEFNAGEVRELKASANNDILIGGPELATQAFQDGLVDECQLYIVPILVGAGKKGLPEGIGAKLELLQERTFGNGTVFLRYRVPS